MNQIELNRIAKQYLDKQSSKLSEKLVGILFEDMVAKKEELPGPTLHHIHNMALFLTLLNMNCFYIKQSKSSEATKQYFELAETLRPKFLEIVETLKDFQPEDIELNDNPNSQEKTDDQ